MASEIIEQVVKDDHGGNGSFLRPIIPSEEFSDTIADADSIIADTLTEPERNEKRGKIIAAMPAYNEEKFIGKTVLGCKPFVEEVIVVNDGSADATAMIATACGATVVYHEQNMGYGAAIRTCFETARKMQARAMVIIDADGQHDPAEIAQVLQPVLDHEADVSIGSRFIEGHKAKIPFYRTVGMKVLDVFTNQAGGVSFTDTQSGFRAYSANAINKIKIGNNGMSAGSEILLQIKAHGLTTKEVPITCRYDIEDTSTHNPVVHGLKVLTSIITEIEYRKPLHYIGIPGLLLLFAGVVNAGFVLNSYNNGSPVPFGPAISMVLLFTMGLLAVFTALNLHAVARIIKECSK
ncbi:MAG: glycosyltransferase family 2 protein [Methanomethylovorans sp.]|uniref:glycosyltransferase family 2 protein n=1 Tax=Methanomethylovorans sp. TaxID=2758717 RepID=UPI003530DD07